MARRLIVANRIGSGPVADVHMGIQEGALTRQVAVKVLRAEWCADAQGAAAFLQGASLQQELAGPGVAAVLDVSEHGGRPAILLPLREGVDLQALVRGPAGEIRSLPLQLALALTRSALVALEPIHSLSASHGQLRPSNIWLDAGGGLTLTDFSPQRPGDRVPGPWTSPEQAAGEAAFPPSDLFALGVFLFEAATGMRLLPADAGSAVAALRVWQPPSSLMVVVPGLVSALLGRWLLGNPAARGTTTEAREALDQAAALASLDISPSVVRSALATFAPPSGTPPSLAPVPAFAFPEIPPAPSSVSPAWSPSHLSSPDEHELDLLADGEVVHPDSSLHAVMDDVELLHDDLPAPNPSLSTSASPQPASPLPPTPPLVPLNPVRADAPWVEDIDLDGTMAASPPSPPPASPSPLPALAAAPVLGEGLIPSSLRVSSSPPSPPLLRGGPAVEDLDLDGTVVHGAPSPDSTTPAQRAPAIVPVPVHSPPNLPPRLAPEEAEGTLVYGASPGREDGTALFPAGSAGMAALPPHSSASTAAWVPPPVPLPSPPVTAGGIPRVLWFIPAIFAVLAVLGLWRVQSLRDQEKARPPAEMDLVSDPSRIEMETEPSPTPPPSSVAKAPSPPPAPRKKSLLRDNVVTRALASLRKPAPAPSPTPPAPRTSIPRPLTAGTTTTVGPSKPPLGVGPGSDPLASVASSSAPATTPSRNSSGSPVTPAPPPGPVTSESRISALAAPAQEGRLSGEDLRFLASVEGGSPSYRASRLLLLTHYDRTGDKNRHCKITEEMFGRADLRHDPEILLEMAKCHQSRRQPAKAVELAEEGLRNIQSMPRSVRYGGTVTLLEILARGYRSLWAASASNLSGGDDRYLDSSIRYWEKLELAAKEDWRRTMAQKELADLRKRQEQAL